MTVAESRASLSGDRQRGLLETLERESGRAADTAQAHFAADGKAKCTVSDERTLATAGIAPDGEGSLITLRHPGVWGDYEDRTRKGWTMILDGLARSFGDSHE